MTEPRLFPDTKKLSAVELSYFAPDNSIKASSLGEAILGMNQCLKEAAEVAILDYDEIFLLPIEKGSVKNTFIFVKKGAEKYKIKEVLLGIGFTITLLNEGLELIQKFGADKVKNPSHEIIAAVSNPKVLELCQSQSFREGAKDIIQPLNEVNKSVSIIYDEKHLEITCDQKYKFYENEQEVILPELKNGDFVELVGEITRINKRTNDLGFSYNGRSLSLIPMEEEQSATEYHRFLETEKVTIEGIVIRTSDYQTPKIKLQEMHEHGQTAFDLDLKK